MRRSKSSNHREAARIMPIEPASRPTASSSIAAMGRVILVFPTHDAQTCVYVG
jgi:hypothetical protein